MNIKSSDHRKRWLAIPDKVREHFEYFMSASESPHPFKCCHPDTLTHWTKAFLREADLPEFHTHSLRHTFATLALEMGMSIRELQKYLDHSDTSVTEIYAHDLASASTAPDIGL